ncbi:hypothetical protein BC629DRAFT_67681 [Irpex lacteus]|nr:hypothetical protein BC629DRAFT_67681 [Irpex lacteus]
MLPSARSSRYDELTSQLQSLEDSRTTILEQLADLDIRIRAVRAERAAVAPLNALPDDVMRLILEEACVHPFAGCRLSRCYEKDQAIVVSHVCRRWRQLAVSTPSIWRCIHVTAPGPPVYNEIVQLFLSRSAELPLSLVLVCLFPNPRSNKYSHLRLRSILEGGVLRCWHRLCGASRRWSSLIILCNTTPLLDVLQEQLGALQLSCLQTLYVYFQASGVPRVGLCEEWTTPALTSVGAFNIPISISNPVFRNLEKLILHERDLDLDYLAMISYAAPRLTTLTLRDIVFESSDEPETPGDDDRTVLLPSLRQLTMARSNIDDVLPALKTPLLEMLWLHWPPPPIYIRGYGPIQSCTFTDLRCNGCNYTHVLHLLSPSVTTLDFTSNPPQDFLRALLPTGDGFLLPRLQTLSISNLDETAIDLLLIVIRARFEGNAPLSTVRIYSSSISSPLLDERLGQLGALSPEIEYIRDLEEPLDLLTNVRFLDMYPDDSFDDGSSDSDA